MFLIVSVSSHCWPYPEDILKFLHIHSCSYLTLDNASAFLCFLPSLYIISKSYGCSLSTHRALLPFNEFSLFINHVNVGQSGTKCPIPPHLLHLFFFLFASNAFLIPSNLLFPMSVITSSSLSSSSSSNSLLDSEFNLLLSFSANLSIFRR